MPSDCTRILVGRDSKSNMFFGHVIPRKGVTHGTYNVDKVKEYIRQVAYNRLILKCDKEFAIVMQTKETQKTSAVEILDEYAHTNNPRSNDMVEEAVGIVKRKTRSVISCLEARLRKRIPNGHTIVGWAVEHAADCMNRYVIRKDGRTAIGRVKGK